jgi:hypothetical protein
VEYGFTSFATNFFGPMHASFCTSAEDGYASASVSECRRHGTAETTGPADNHGDLVIEFKWIGMAHGNLLGSKRTTPKPMTRPRVDEDKC